MADTAPKRKEYDSADWQTVALENARAREAAQKRKSLLEALAKYIQGNGGWVTSVPGAKETRIEVLKDSTLPTRLAELGYTPRHCGVSTRLTSSGFMPVDVVSITLEK